MRENMTRGHFATSNWQGDPNRPDDPLLCLFVGVSDQAVVETHVSKSDLFLFLENRALEWTA